MLAAVCHTFFGNNPSLSERYFIGRIWSFFLRFCQGLEICKDEEMFLYVQILLGSVVLKSSVHAFNGFRWQVLIVVRGRWFHFVLEMEVEVPYCRLPLQQMPQQPTLLFLHVVLDSQVVQLLNKERSQQVIDIQYSTYVYALGSLASFPATHMHLQLSSRHLHAVCKL